jgi:preprotein translocase subunit SecD
MSRVHRNLACVVLAAAALGSGGALAGGVELVYRVDGEAPEAVSAAARVVGRRLAPAERAGHASVRVLDDGRIAVRLVSGRGDPSVEQAKLVIAFPGRLDFKIVVEPDEPDFSEGTLHAIEESKRAGHLPAGAAFDVACARDGAPLLLRNEDAVEGRLLASAHRLRGEGEPALVFEMTREGRERLARTTEKWLNHRLAIVVDGKVISSPFVKTPITDGSGVIEGGGLGKAEIEALAVVLGSGELPATLTLVSESALPDENPTREKKP